jgi:vacuolar protein-sorting-associated protein 4
VDNLSKFTPCLPTDSGAVAMTYRDISTKKLLEPPLQMIDFIQAMQTVCTSVDTEELKRFEGWTKKFGIAG